MWAWGGEFGFGLAILRSVDSVLCPVRVGRSDELSAVTALVNRAAEGRGGGAFVLGEPGVGKSRLVREVSTFATDRGCMCSPVGRSLAIIRCRFVC